MASTVYPKYKEALLQAAANVSLSSGAVKCIPVDSADYTYSSGHDFLDDVPSGARIGTAQTLNTKTFTSGVFDADDVLFTGLTGDQFEAIIIFIDTGVESTSRLVAYIDSGTGMPFSPNGGNLTVQWNASGIFAL